MANKFTNVKSLEVKLNAIGKGTALLVGRALRRGGLRIENTAAEGIISPPKSGRTYSKGTTGRKRKNGKWGTGSKTKFHRASAPGEFPAADTGRLHQSLTTAYVERGPERYVIQTGANTPYARRLELGGAHSAPNGTAITIAPRPFMSPSFKKNKDAIIEDVKQAIVKGARSRSEKA